MIMKETERMEKPLKLEIRDLRQNLMKEVTSKNSLEAGMVMLKAQQEKQGQKEELLTKTIEELKSDIKEWSDKFHALGNVISEINSTVKDHGNPSAISLFIPLPDDKILDWSKLKQIADNILKCI